MKIWGLIEVQIDHEYYIKLIENNELAEARTYKGRFIPQKLYKYVSLSDKCCEMTLSLNEQKLKSLENEKIWLSTPDNLNDPFELNALFFDQRKLLEHNWNMNLHRTLLEQLRSYFLIGSFCGKLDTIMPMWAHYSNNHKGFCIEYEVKDSNSIFPVIYEDKRLEVTSILSNLLYQLKNSRGFLTEESNRELIKLMSLLFISNCVKHTFWQYEDEYRILYPKEQLVEKGQLVNNHTIGLKVKGIYVGVNCEENYINRLKEISLRLKIPIKKMNLDKYSKEFQLGIIPI